MTKQAVLSLSGGLDSSTLLLHLLDQGYAVTCLSFDYGQKHKIELERAQQLVEYLNSKCEDGPKENPNIFKYIPVNHQIIKLDGLSQLLNSTLVEGGEEVPDGHYTEESQRQTVVPNRNKIFSSIIQAVALSIANKYDCEVKIALGIHAGDSTIYPDCREEFRNADFVAFSEGNWDAHRVTYYTPYLHLMKYDILRDGEKCCTELGLDFDEVYRQTNTSYKPMKHKVRYSDGTIGEEWFADFTSGSSIERIEAFIKLGRPDPTSYADDFGPVSWAFVKECVSSLLQKYETQTSTPKI